MKKILARTGLGLVLLALVIALALTWHVRGKRPQRDGELALAGLTAAVTVRYDDAGVPHLADFGLAARLDEARAVVDRLRATDPNALTRTRLDVTAPDIRLDNDAAKLRLAVLGVGVSIAQRQIQGQQCGSYGQQGFCMHFQTP